ncbi:hypothetical protein C8J57DRAFT_1518279 [Mycena rebaudengoi]|nr:hypothetical protein C8J57DRAFT_1518279 [Mycena rebaudengoi]
MRWGVSTLSNHGEFWALICAYNHRLSARGAASDVPSLVDLAAERLTDSESLADETIDDIPLMILRSYVWRWHRIPYPTLCRALLRLSSEDVGSQPGNAAQPLEDSPKNIDEWVLLNEKWLRDVEQAQWQHGLVTLDDADIVFPKSILTESARTISRPVDLPGHGILCEARASQISIQPSVEAFKRKFEGMSDGLLKNLDWSNLFVAGGIVLGTLLSVDTPEGRPSSISQWKMSDIDIYVYGLSATKANEKIEQLYDVFCSNLPPGTRTLVVKNSKTITFYAHYPLRRIQIVLKLIKSPRDVLLNFDLDICAVGWDGSQVWLLPRAVRALETGYNVFTMNLIQGHYLSERRASQPQRLPLWRKSVRGENLCLEIPLLSENARAWTKRRHLTVLRNIGLNRMHYSDLEDVDENQDPRSVNCLTGFTLFMRHVALWEMGQRKEVIIEEDNRAFNSYEDSYYEDGSQAITQYKWDSAFTLAGFRSHIKKQNANEMAVWFENGFGRLRKHGVKEGSELDTRSMTCASTLKLLMNSKHDIVLPVLLPCDFAVYTNDLVAQVQHVHGLEEKNILMRAVKGYQFPDHPEKDKEGLFKWRIRSELMWQQLDRRVDEVFEALQAFRRVNEGLAIGEEDSQAWRLSKELSRREAHPASGNEFDSFARWVGKNA